jgi:hypothetical protein
LDCIIEQQTRVDKEHVGGERQVKAGRVLSCPVQQRSILPVVAMIYTLTAYSYRFGRTYLSGLSLV